MRHIKKYGNRRLYDTEASAYVNLAQLAEYVKAGEQITVSDAKSGEDLTHLILLQLLIDQQGADILPIGLLHRLLRFSMDGPMHQAAVRQVSLGLQVLDQQLVQAEKQWPWMRPASTPAAPAASQEPDAAPTSPAAAPQPPPVADPELDALRARLADLENRLRS